MKPCTSLCPTPRMLCPLLPLSKLVSPQYVVCALLVSESLGSTSNLKTARGQVLRTCFLTSCPGWFNGPDSLRTPHPGRQMSTQFPPLLLTTASPASDVPIFRIAIYLNLPCLLDGNFRAARKKEEDQVVSTSCARHSMRSSEVNVIDLVLQIRKLKFKKLNDWFWVTQLLNGGNKLTALILFFLAPKPLFFSWHRPYSTEHQGWSIATFHMLSPNVCSFFPITWT